MEYKKLSIIVPVYKVEKYIERCIESLQNQSYPNLEIILVDDGSPDNCPAICDKYAATDNRIIVIHKKNGGLCSARNTGLERATGDFITFVDSDDWVDKECYKQIMGYIVDNQLDIIGGIDTLDLGKLRIKCLKGVMTGHCA